MNRDIVTTLRTQEQMYRQMGNVRQGEILARAAEEIERLRELREAVTWERECKEQLMFIFHDDEIFPHRFSEMLKIAAASRAEVDRLIGEGEG